MVADDFVLLVVDGNTTPAVGVDVHGKDVARGLEGVLAGVCVDLGLIGVA